jgi:hypothetical protein
MGTKPQIGTPEYDQAMSDLVDNSVQPEVDELANTELNDLNGQEPEESNESNVELPEGVSMDDLLAAWKAQNGQEESQVTDGNGEENAEEDTTPETDEEEGEEESNEEEGNELETRVKQLEEQLVTEKIYSAAGGKEQYESLREQAESQLDEQQVELLNMALVNGTPDQAVAAVRLMQKFTNMQQTSPDSKIEEGNMIQGGRTASTKYFSSQDEMMDAMRDPRYSRQDAVGHAYREEVLLKASKL